MAGQLGTALRLDHKTQQQLAAELRHSACAAWERQRSAMLATAASVPNGAPDAGALVAAATTLFESSSIPGLAGDLGSLQRSSVFRTLLLLGLAEGVEASDQLLLRPAAGGIAIVETLHGLDHALSEDEPARLVFGAAADAVMWGAAVAIAEKQLQAQGGARPAAADEVLVVVDDHARGAELAGTSAWHVLSFEDFDNAFTFQGAVFERVPAVTEVQFTNPEKVQSLVNTPGAAVDASTFGRHVVVVLGPASVGYELKALALAHVGIYERHANG